MSKLDEAREELRKCIQPDGGLHNLGWYLQWSTENNEACLDGYFSPEELIAIAEHMLKNFKPERNEEKK